MIEEIMKALWVKASVHKKLKERARKQDKELKELIAEIINDYFKK